jgi:putative transposase
MHDLIVLLVHLFSTVLRLFRPGGLRSVVAESVLIKHQLLIVNRSRHRAPNLRVSDRLIVGFCSLWIKPTRLLRAAIALKPSTLLHFHRALVQRKYRLLFSPKRRTKPGPKGPNPELNSCRCCDEAAESDVGMSSYCQPDYFGLRQSL